MKRYIVAIPVTNYLDNVLTLQQLCSLFPCCCWGCCVASVVSDSVRPHRWQPTRLPRPWDSPGKNTGVGSHVTGGEIGA